MRSGAHELRIDYDFMQDHVWVNVREPSRVEVNISNQILTIVGGPCYRRYASAYLTLYVDGLDMTHRGDIGVNFYSSNSTVASVQGHVVHGNAPGTASICLNNGSNCDTVIVSDVVDMDNDTHIDAIAFTNYENATGNLVQQLDVGGETGYLYPYATSSSGTVMPLLPLSDFTTYVYDSTRVYESGSLSFKVAEDAKNTSDNDEDYAIVGLAMNISNDSANCSTTDTLRPATINIFMSPPDVAFFEFKNPYIAHANSLARSPALLSAPQVDFSIARAKSAGVYTRAGHKINLLEDTERFTLRVEDTYRHCVSIGEDNQSVSATPSTVVDSDCDSVPINATFIVSDRTLVKKAYVYVVRSEALLVERFWYPTMDTSNTDAFFRIVYGCKQDDSESSRILFRVRYTLVVANDDNNEGYYHTGYVNLNSENVTLAEWQLSRIPGAEDPHPQGGGLVYEYKSENTGRMLSDHSTDDSESARLDERRSGDDQDDHGSGSDYASSLATTPSLNYFTNATENALYTSQGITGFRWSNYELCTDEFCVSQCI